MTVMDWEAKFTRWAKAPGKSEEERCENAIKAIKNAIGNSEQLKRRNIRVFVQGSYRNNVNVRRDSDVDIGVLCFDTLFPVYPEGDDAKKFEESIGHVDATYTYAQFKTDVFNALVNHFGRTSVHRGNKAIDVKENSYHVDADVAPFFEHRRYTSTMHYHSGVELRPDNGGGRIINWPEQHYENGVSKNTETSRRYKGAVRILKSLRIEMDDAGIAAAQPVVGFLIECLVWNVPNDRFMKDTWDERIQGVLSLLWNNTKEASHCEEWGEVSELKYLFKGSQDSKRRQAHEFINAAWDYVGVRK